MLQSNNNNAPLPGGVSMNKKVRTYTLSVAALAVIAAILRAAALLTAFDREIGFFASGSLLITVSNAMLALAAVWAVSALFLIPAGVLPADMGTNRKFSVFFSAFAAGVFIVGFVRRLIDLSVDIKDGTFGQMAEILLYPKRFPDAAYRTTRVAFVLSLVCIIADLISAIYFFMQSLPRKNGQTLGLAAMVVDIRLLAGIALIYFDLTLAMNSPNKTILQIGMACAMLFLLAETRFLLGGEYVRPRLFVTTALMTVLVCFAGGAACLFGFFSGALHKFSYFATEGLTCLALGMYAFARLMDYSGARAEIAEKTEAEIPAQGDGEKTAEPAAKEETEETEETNEEKND